MISLSAMLKALEVREGPQQPWDWSKAKTVALTLKTVDNESPNEDLANTSDEITVVKLAIDGPEREDDTLDLIRSPDTSILTSTKNTDTLTDLLVEFGFNSDDSDEN